MHELVRSFRIGRSASAEADTGRDAPSTSMILGTAIRPPQVRRRFDQHIEVPIG